jgi:hypothetical protein
MTKTLNQIIFFFLHQKQNIFFSNIGNQNIFLEKKHTPPFKLNGRSPSKVLESIIMGHSEPKLKHAQNALQRGYTEETAPLNAGIIATEAICEAKDNGVAMGFITLDAEKAFDVLGHEHSMCKLYHDGLMDDLWNFIRILQTESITKTKWRGKLGDIFFNRQGIRQGAKLSPSLYKRYN